MLKDEDKDLFPLLEVNVKIWISSINYFYEEIFLVSKEAPTKKLLLGSVTAKSDGIRNFLLRIKYSDCIKKILWLTKCHYI